MCSSDLIPLALKPNSYSVHWVSVYEIFEDIDTQKLGVVKKECASIFHYLAEQLQSASRDRNLLVTQQVWMRLMWMKSARLLDGTAVTRMKQILWADAQPGHWPIVPGHQSWATLSLEARGLSIERKYLRWLREQTLVTFRAHSSELSSPHNGRISWATTRGHDPLIAWREHLVAEREAGPRDINACLNTILDWWDAEGDDLTKQLSGERGRLEELQSGLIQRGELVDELIWRIWTRSASPLMRPKAQIWSRIPEFANQIEALGTRLWRTRLALAAERGDSREMNAIDKTLSSEFLAPSAGDRSSQRRTILDWIAITASPAPLLFRSLIGTVATNRPSGLSQALDALSLLVKEYPQWVYEDDVALIITGLAALAPKLSYTGRVAGSGIEDDEVPLLRFMCARLAEALQQRRRDDVSQNIARRWLESAATDPLPEMRLKRFSV